MRSPSAVSVERVVFHEITGERDDRQLSLSDAIVDFDDMDPDDEDLVHEYLRRHVEQSLADSQSVAVNFVDAAHPTPHAIHTAFESSQLLDASQDLARRLKEILDADGRIAPGTLAVLHYVPAFDGEEGDRSIGIIKLNPAPGFTVRRDLDGGNITLTLDTVNGVLPSVRERLQKCAFVRPHAEDEDFQVLALDRQTRGDGLASWFLDRFLDAAPIATDTDRTEAFYVAAAHARDAIDSDLTSEQRRHLDAARASALGGLRIDVVDFVDNLGMIEGETKDRYRTIITEGITDPSFVVDLDLAKRLLRQPKYTGDHGLTVKIDRDFQHLIGDEPEFDKAEGRHFVRIYTETWNTPDEGD